MKKERDFNNLSFSDFRKMATDESLTQYEKIGFPDSYRKGKEERIFADIVCKLHNLENEKQVILDIGAGCSDLAFILIDFCRIKKHELILIDSQEMLALLPDEDFIKKIPGYYPKECEWLFDNYRGRINAILTYSVLHYVFVEGNLFNFLDQSLGLLADGGEMLIGDIPNISKRKRFFFSQNGILFHQAFMNTSELPEVKFNAIEENQIDDAVILAITHRARASGFDAYILPQAEDLPMANRREDIIIKKP